jgi:hypothetical protein
MTRAVDDSVLNMTRAGVIPSGPLASSRLLGAIAERSCLTPSGFPDLRGVYCPCGFPVRNP